jgi:hypothetical protein
MSRKHIDTPRPGRQEQGFMRRMAELLGQGRAGLEGGAYQQNMLAPYLYDLAGLDVQYEDRSPRLQELQAQRDKALSGITELRSAKGKKAKRAAVESLRSGGGLEDLANKKGKIKTGKLKRYLQAQLSGAERESGELAASPLRITGVTEKEGAKASREQEERLLKTQRDLLEKSLSMNDEDVLAADPALRRRLQEEQAQLEQAQVQQFGSLANAQGGTVGAVQNAAMAQRRGEAVSNARRENIGLYAGLQTQQAGQNTQQAAARGALGSLPGSQQSASGMNFGQLSGGYAGLLNAMQAQRQMQFQANSFNQTQPTILESVGKGIGSLLQPFKQNE